MAGEEGQQSAPPDAGGGRKEAEPRAESAGEAGQGKDSPGLRGGGAAFDVQVAVATARSKRIYHPGADEWSPVHIGPRNSYFQLAGAVAPTPGPVRTEMLTSTARRYVRVDRYEEMEDALRQRRLLLLGGASATGRSTTGLRLLNALAGDAVSRLDQATDLRTLEENDLDRGRGYLAELGESAAGFAATTADRIADLLHRCDAYLVVIVPPEGTRGEVFTAYGADCGAPDTDALVRRYLQAQLSGNGLDDLENRLVKFADSPEVRSALGPAPQVREAVELAGLLIAHGRGERSAADIEDTCRRFVDRQVDEWFESLRNAKRGEAQDKEVRLIALRIAVAVLHQMPRGAVMELAEDLADRLFRVIRPVREPSRRLIAEHEDTLLAATRACVVSGTIRYAGGPPVPTEDLKFRDDRFPQAVLSHVWRRHHNLRPPIADWIRRLAEDNRPWVRACAAHATGVLCWVDFSWTFEAIIDDAAGAVSDDADATSNSRWPMWDFAARALDWAAQDQRHHPAVKGILRHWRREGVRSQRCTAAVAWGLEIGGRSVDEALVELRIIGTPQELDARDQQDEEAYAEHEDLIWGAGLSVARLLANGATGPAFERLLRWIGPGQRRSVQLLALQTVWVLAGMRAQDLSADLVGGPGAWSAVARFTGRESWPLLLAMLGDDPALASSVTEVLLFALRGPHRMPFADLVGRWLMKAQEDDACFAVLADLLPVLGKDGEDRLRLQYMIERRGRSWADPLRPDVVKRLVDQLTAREGR